MYTRKPEAPIPPRARHSQRLDDLAQKRSSANRAFALYAIVAAALLFFTLFGLVASAVIQNDMSFVMVMVVSLIGLTSITIGILIGVSLAFALRIGVRRP